MLSNSHGNYIELVKTGDRTEFVLSQRRELRYVLVMSSKKMLWKRKEFSELLTSVQKKVKPSCVSEYLNSSLLAAWSRIQS